MIVLNDDGSPKIGPDGRAVIVRCTIHDLDLQEFSAVDAPAHEGARAAIQRRAPILTTESHQEPSTMTTPDLASVQADLSKAQAALTSVTAERDALQKRFDYQGKLVGLTDAERAHLETLDEAERPTWVGKSKAARQADVDAALAADPVVVTLPDGTSVRKSAGSLQIGMAKTIVMQAKQLSDSNEVVERTRLEKRAATELGNVGGDAAGKVALLKAVEGIADEATRKSAEAVLKSANTVAKQVFTTRGTGAGGDGSETPADAHDFIMKRAEVYAKEHKVPVMKAYGIITDPKHDDRDEEAIAAYERAEADRRGNTRT